MRPELENLPEPNWFHHGVQILDLLEDLKPKVCVELGTNRGCSAIPVARLIRKWGGLLYCVDTWGMAEPDWIGLGEFLQNVRSAGVEDTTRILHMDTATAARNWTEEGSVDYLYIDADHSYEGCTADLENWWPKLRRGGLLTGDDYDDPHGNGRMSQAWDDFERKYGLSFQRTVSPELLGCQCERCKAARLIWIVKE